MKPRDLESSDPAEEKKAAQAGELLTVSQFYTYRMHKLSTLLGRQMHELLQERYGLGLAEWRTISVLKEHGPTSLREVARIGAIDKAQVSRLLPVLVARGFVERTDHPTDRRRASLSLTEEGRLLFSDIYKIGVKRQAWLGEALDAADRAVFDDCLDRLIARVETCPEGSFGLEEAV